MTERSHSHRVRLAEAASAIAAIVLVIIGLLGVVGRVLGVGLVLSLGHRLSPMRLEAAAASLLTGVGLWFAQRRRAEGQASRLVARTSASLVLLLSLAALGEDLLGWRLSLSTWLAAERLSLGPPMASHAALGFLLLGAALLCLDRPTHRLPAPAEWLAVLAGAIGMVALVGYLYGASALYELKGAGGAISLPSVLAVVCGALGLLACRPTRGLTAALVDEHAGGALARRFLPPILLLPVLLDLGVGAGERRGFYGEHIATALHTVAVLAVTFPVLWLMTVSLNRSDAERERRAREILKLNAESERRVEERTAALQATNRELVNAMAERRRVEAEGQRRSRQQAAVAELGLQFLRTSTIQELLDKTVVTVTRMLETELGEVLELSPDGERLLLRAGLGWSEGLVGEATVNADRSTQAGFTLQSRAVVIVRDLAAETRFRGPPLPREHAVVSGMSVMIGEPDHPFGVLGVHSRQPRAFSQDDAHFLQAAANLLADALTRRRAEEAVRASEDRYRSLVLATAQIVWTADAHGQVITDLPRWRAFTGQCPEAIQGWGWADAVHPEDRPNALRRWEQALKAASAYEVEYRLRRHDQCYRHMAVRGVPVRNADGSVREWVGTCTDVTAARELEAELRRTSRYMRSLIEASLDPLVAISPAGTITDVNQATEAATGRARAELVGSDFADYFTEAAQARAGYQRVIACGAVRDYPLTIRHTSGRTTDVLYNAAVYRNDAGAVQGVFAAARDITARKRAEEQLEQTALELARSNAELERFAYVASHDLQEPLRMVISYLQLLERRYQERLDANAREFIGFAVDGAKRMSALINDLLSFSRVGTRGQPFSSLSAAVPLTRALANLAVALKETQARVTQDPLPAIKGDVVQLTQLFQNLIGNAVKFRGVASPCVHISARPAGLWWRFAVEDNGIGIDPRFHDRIFLLFQRLHTREEYPGTGMGLAICKKIVERHGGRIWVESAPGQGATFYFTLPAPEPGPPSPALPTPSET